MREWIARILAVVGRGRRDRDLADELAFHVEQQARAHERAGLDPARAREAAVRDLGGIDRTQQAWRDQRTWPPLEDLLQDAQYGWRMLRRSPSVTLVAVLTLALAVAATTSVFALVDAVLLAPLPYPQADRLVWLTELYRPTHSPGVSVSPGHFLDWRGRSHAFMAMTAIARRQQNLTQDGDPLQVSVAAVSADFAATVGVTPDIGRGFHDDEFSAGHEQVAVLDHGIWTERYGADPNVVGRSVMLDGQTYAIVGVMPAGFVFPNPGVDLWVPMPLAEADRQNRTGHTLAAVGRLHDGIGIEAADREMRDVATALGRTYPDSDGDWGVVLQSARDALIGSSGAVIVAVAGAVALLLLVACANVAGLLLTHGLSRGRELAIRMAVGAGRHRLVRQLLTESVLLALVSGALGAGLAAAAQPVLNALRPATLVLWKPVAIDARALLFALTATTIAGVVFGTLPAFFASRAHTGALASSRTAGRGSSGARQALIAFEVALALVLVVGAALFAETLGNLNKAPLGFDPDHVVTMTVSLPEGRYGDDGRVDTFYDEFFTRLRALPGVAAAGATSALPLSGNTSVRPYHVPGGPSGRQSATAHYRIVVPGYFAAMRIPLIAGRRFDERDTARHPLAVIVNETFAHGVWGTHANPIGQRVTFGGADNLWAEVVGVVGDVHHFQPGSPPVAEMYWPSAQVDATQASTLRRFRRNLTLVVRGDERKDAASLVPSIRGALQAVDAQQPIASVRTMASYVDDSLVLARDSAWILAIFGTAAALFAVMGIFGAASYAAAQRRRELAVRLALGAAPSAVTRLVVRSTLTGTAVGVAVGLGLAVAFGHSVSSLLVDVRPTDPRTLAAVSVFLAAIATIACWLPARRAARVDPLEALRVE